MRSMCSTVLFSLTESRTRFHAPPCSLKTSFCGSVNRIAVPCQLMFIILSLFDCHVSFPLPGSSELLAHLQTLQSLSSRMGSLTISLTNEIQINGFPLKHET